MRRMRTRTSYRLNVRDIPEKDVAISCRVRLARNLSEHVFPDRASHQQRAQVLQQTAPRILSRLPKYDCAILSECTELERLALFEQHLISKELLERGEAGAVVLAPDHSVSVMINEEDHLRIQGFAAGMDFATAWKKADELDSEIETNVHYAWIPRLGYLTACPSNLGTGMRASVMLHLIGLRMTGEQDQVIRGIERMRLLARGISGEGSEPSGQLFQVSNMEAIGMTETAIIERLRRICQEVIHQECNARARIIRNSPLLAADFLTRAFSLLANVQLITTGEAMELLSALRFGASVGLVSGLTVKEIDHLMLTINPAHLQLFFKDTLDSDERDELRATLLRMRMEKVSLKV